MKSIKNLALSLVACAIITTSCVDNVVSPTVEAIRTQQVEWLKAKTASEVALAAYQTIQNDYEKALNDIKLLDAGYTSKMNEMTYLQAIESNKVTLKQAEIQLKQAESDLAVKLVALKLAADQSGSEQASNYYNNYSTQASQLSSLYTQKVNKENEIAGLNLIISNNTNLWDYQKKAIQYDIDALNLSLTAQKASLVVLQSNLVDKTAIQTQIDLLSTSNTDLNKKNSLLSIDKANAEKVKSEKYTIYSSAASTVTTMTGYKSALKTNATNITSNTSDIAIKTSSLANAQSNLVSAQSDLAAKQVIYDNAKANYTVKETDYKNKLAMYESKQNDYNKAAAAYDLAYSEWSLNPSNTALTTAKDNALTAKNTATTAMNSAFSDFNTSSIAKNTVYNNVFYPAENNLISSKSAVSSRETSVTNAETTLATANALKKTLDLEKVRLEGLISGLQTAYITASTNLEKYYSDYMSAMDAVTVIVNKITENDVIISQNSTLKSSLQSIYNGTTTVSSQISSLKIQIAVTEQSIADKSNSLITYSNSKTYSEAQVANLTKDLAVITTKITEVEKMMTYWKTLLDGILK